MENPELQDTGWPTPATVAQGWLSNRWQRRDGNVYGVAGAGRGAEGPNSPIAGGEDEAALVDVSSGVPRS